MPPARRPAVDREEGAEEQGRRQAEVPQVEDRRPQTPAPPLCATHADAVETVRAALASLAGVVVCAEAKKTSGGWNVIAYVQGQLLQAYREHILATAQQALFASTQRLPDGAGAAGEAAGAWPAEGVCLVGYAASPFAQMPLGFGCAVADLVPGACRSAFAKGFCDKPGSCHCQHPKAPVGINVMLKRARR